MSVEGYGRIFVPFPLEDDIVRLLAPDVEDNPVGVEDGQDWLWTLLLEVARQHDIDPDTLPAVRSWNDLAPEDDWPIDRLPSIVVMVGSADDPERDEEGIHTDLLRVEIAAVCSAHTYREARRDAGVYAMAARAAIVQQLVDNSDWVDGVAAGPHAPRRIPLRDAERLDTVAAHQVAFVVTVPDSLSDTVSVTLPPPDPTEPAPDDPTVAEGAVEITTTIS